MRSLGFAGILARYYNENRGSGDGLPPQFRGYSPDIGEVQERLNWRHWKCRVLERGPWVRIPPSPPPYAVSYGRQAVHA